MVATFAVLSAITSLGENMQNMRVVQDIKDTLTSRFITTREPIVFFTNLLECLFLTGLYLDFISQYRNLGMGQEKKMQNVSAKITQPKTD